MRYVLLLSLALILVNCGDKPSTIDDFHTSDLTLPGGEVLKVETMIRTGCTKRRFRWTRCGWMTGATLSKSSKTPRHAPAWRASVLISGVQPRLNTHCRWAQGWCGSII